MSETDLRVISLGAGVQSSAMLLMSLYGDIERADCAIFADTGWEPKAVYGHLERIKDECAKYDFPLYVISKGNIREDVLLHIEAYHSTGNKWSRAAQPPFMVIDHEGKEGLPPDTGGRLWRQCSREYKVDPIQRKIRELLGYKPKQRVTKQVESWQGISVDEAHRMRDSRVKWMTNKYPLVDKRMDRNNCQHYLERHGWENVPKSACVGCPYHSNAYWRDQRDNRPDEWNDSVEFDYMLRKRPYPGVTGTVYIHRDMVPLDEVNLTTKEDLGQLNLFGEECEGICGV